MGSLQHVVFFDRVTYFDFPKSARAYLFPQSLKIHCFCSGPISADPVCPQPRCRKLWKRMDRDCDGYITRAELNKGELAETICR